MDDLELIKIINVKIENGIGGPNSGVSQTREDIMDRYLGELYGDEREGESHLTTREVFDTVEWALPSVLRVFESGDRVVEFDANGPDDEAAAEQETDACNYVYQKDNRGYVVSSNMVKSALMMPNSYVMVWRDEKKDSCTEHYENMSIEEIAYILQSDDVEIVGQEMTAEGLYTIDVKKTYSRGRIKVSCLPEEEIIVDSNHSELSLDDCEFVCHQYYDTYSNLIAEGYKKKDLDAVGVQKDWNSEDDNRKTYYDENQSDDELHKPLKKLLVQKCFMLVDWDGDDIAERRQVVKIGDKIFENDELAYMPVASAASILMPHKHTGLSFAQVVEDIQKSKTYFTRQLSNNMSQVNNPRTLITGGANLNDLLNKKNNYVRIKQVGDVTTEPTQPVIQNVIPLLELFDQMKENRTGVTRHSMGLDADVLAQSTEGAFMGALEKADQRIENLVRLLAETVFTDIFLKIHHLLLSYGDTKYMKLSGQWVLVNPREWKTRESMTVVVGLGLGNQRQKMASAQMITQDHDRIIASGGLGFMINHQNVYNGRRKLVEATGEKNVDKYYMNPATIPPKPPEPPQPDPNMLMIQSNERIEQGKRQMDMAKLNQEGQIKFAQFQFEQAKAARDGQFQQIELSYKREIETLKAQISQSKNASDAEVKEQQNRIDMLEQELKDAQTDEKLAMDKYRADLDAETKILLKAMDGNSEPEQVAQDNNLEVITAIIAEMNRPKRIIRDENDEIVGVEPQ